MAEGLITPVITTNPERLSIPRGPEVMKFPELTTSFTEALGVLKEGQNAGIFKRTAQEWGNCIDQKIDARQKSVIALSLSDLGEHAEAGINTLRQYEEKEKAKEIAINPDGTVAKNQTKPIQELIDKSTAAYTHAVRGINLIIAATEGKTDAKSIELQRKAQEILLKIKNNIVVVPNNARQGPAEVSYTDWQEAVKGKAAYHCKAKIPSEGTPNKITLLAYEHFVESKMAKNSSGLRYEFIYKPDQNVEVPKFEEVQNNTIKATDAIFKKITGLAVEQLDTDTNAEISADPILSRMVFLRLRLDGELIKPQKNLSAIQMLTAQLSSVAQDCLDYHRDSVGNDLQETRNLLLRNKDYYQQEGNNPIVNYSQGRIAARGYSREDAQFIDHGKLMYIITLLDPAIKFDMDHPPDHYSSEPSRVSGYISKLSAAGAINGQEEGWLRFLESRSRGDQNWLIDERNHSAQAIGMAADERRDLLTMTKTHGFGLNNFLRNQRPAIDKLLNGEAPLPPNASRALDSLMNFTPDKINLFPKDGFWSLNHSIALIIAWNAIQGIFSETGDEEGPPNQGPH